MTPPVGEFRWDLPGATNAFVCRIENGRVRSRFGQPRCMLQSGFQPPKVPHRAFRDPRANWSESPFPRIASPARASCPRGAMPERPAYANCLCMMGASGRLAEGGHKGDRARTVSGPTPLRRWDRLGQACKPAEIGAQSPHLCPASSSQDRLTLANIHNRRGSIRTGSSGSCAATRSPMCYPFSLARFSRCVSDWCCGWPGGDAGRPVSGSKGLRFTQ